MQGYFLPPRILILSEEYSNRKPGFDNPGCFHFVAEITTPENE